MRTSSIVLVCVLIGLAQAKISYLDVVEAEFRAFKDDYQKVYENVDEELKRMQIFIDNKKMIDSHNERYAAGEETYKMGVNQFADLLPSEFQSQMLTYRNTSKMDADIEYTNFPDDLEAPRAIDWRRRGAVTAVKNQKDCGSCWAFAAAGVLESHHYIKTRQLIELSEQNLMDCSRRYHNYGCNGGTTFAALHYVKDNGGLDTEEAYPYKARDGFCHFSRSKIGAKVLGVQRVAPNENALAKAVGNYGPVVVSVDATYFQFYTGDVFKGPCSRQTNHEVIVVGYGTDYWLIKNSWGSRWGEHGYMRLARNYNLCNIAGQAVYPIV